ncbi:hypothetical protein C7S16_4095 [Burkholderia thailandensis]|uniref:Uncharacterized protein n=1 Tax=Burkholderia thailandensis TaxID=57975 RepID=A0AAW9CY87_BURTH|nr:hypothetical protein [Burkholderia thailandensis]
MPATVRTGAPRRSARLRSPCAAHAATHGGAPVVGIVIGRLRSEAV